jgi:hypothetical protein
VERGQKEPSSELLAAICDALEVKLSDILLELSTELAAAELAAELEAAELGQLNPSDARQRTRVPMPSRSGDSQQGAPQRPMVVGVGTAAPRRAGTLPTAKIPTAVINQSPVGSRPGNRPSSGSPVRADAARMAAKRGTTVPQAALGSLPYSPGGPLPGPDNPYTFGAPRLTPSGR